MPSYVVCGKNIYHKDHQMFVTNMATKGSNPKQEHFRKLSIKTFQAD